MKNYLLIVLISIISISVQAQSTENKKNIASSVLVAKDIIAKKTTVSTNVLDRIAYAFDFYEQQKIKSQASFGNNAKALEEANSKISNLKKKQLTSILPANEFAKLSVEDIIAICK
jgi:L-cystine uptake protein TcyP (sodium:dicarboxylate symporter family)